MTTLGVAEAKGQFSELVKRAAGGESFVITRNGKPMAWIVPPLETAQAPASAPAPHPSPPPAQSAPQRAGLTLADILKAGR